jgi:hypothetical protein
LNTIPSSELCTIKSSCCGFDVRQPHGIHMYFLSTTFPWVMTALKSRLSVYSSYGEAPWSQTVTGAKPVPTSF